VLRVVPSGWMYVLITEKKGWGQVGRVGNIGPQLKADRSKAGSTAGRMRPKGLKGAARSALPEFFHRYGHFAPQTSPLSTMI
jgi:hypothetical protein